MKILECPFCGSTPTITNRQGGENETPFLCFIVCYCGTYSAHAHQTGRGKTPAEAQQNAIAAWNYRKLK